MQKHQNSVKDTAQKLALTGKQSNELNAENLNLNYQVSSPKFNRKTDFRWTEKKQGKAVTPNQQRIVYISPCKNSSIHNFYQTSLGFVNPPSPDVKKFTNTNDDFCRSSKMPSDYYSNDNQFDVEFCNSPSCALVSQQKDREIKSLKASVQKLQALLLKKNKEIKKKKSQLESVQVFLLERETFISQLTEINIKMNQNLTTNQNFLKDLEDKYQELKKIYEKDSALWENKLKMQKEEIQKSHKKKKSSQIPQQGKGKQKKSQRKSSKENNESANRGPLKTFAKPIHRSLHNQKDNSRKQGEEFKFHDLNITEERCVTQIQALIPQAFFTQGSEDNSSILTNPKTPRSPHIHKQEKIIKTLQQKIRYSEIQKDVLKKIKLDSVKIKDDNDKLKCQNRKLLHRIDYLTRNFNRKGCNSDSSLELSLSPVKH